MFPYWGRELVFRPAMFPPQGPGPSIPQFFEVPLYYMHTPFITALPN